MKKSLLLKFAAVLFVAVAFVGCNKYEEGGNFSLLTAKMRVINEWVSTSYTVTTGAGSVSNNVMNLTIRKDGSYTNSGTLLGFSVSENGTWTLNSDKTQLLLTSGSTTDTWDIAKLKNNELKLVQTETVLGFTTTYTVELEGK